MTRITPSFGRIVSVTCLLAALLTWFARGQSARPGYQVKETGTNYLDDLKFFVSGARLGGTNANGLLKMSGSNLLWIVGNATNTLGTSSVTTNDILGLLWANGNTNWLTLAGTNGLATAGQLSGATAFDPVWLAWAMPFTTNRVQMMWSKDLKSWLPAFGGKTMYLPSIGRAEALPLYEPGDGYYYTATEFVRPGVSYYQTTNFFWIARTTTNRLTDFTDYTRVWATNVTGLTHLWAMNFLRSGTTNWVFFPVSTDNGTNFSPYYSLSTNMLDWTVAQPVNWTGLPYAIDFYPFSRGGTNYFLYKWQTTGTTGRLEMAYSTAGWTNGWTALKTNDWAGWGTGWEAGKLLSISNGHDVVIADRYGSTGAYSEGIGLHWSESTNNWATWSTMQPYGFSSPSLRHTGYLLVTNPADIANATIPASYSLTADSGVGGKPPEYPREPNYHHFWIGGKASVILETFSAAYKSVSLAGNAYRYGGGDSYWKLVETNRPGWMVAAGWGTSSDGIYFLRAPPATGTASFSVIGGLNSTGFYGNGSGLTDIAYSTSSGYATNAGAVGGVTVGGLVQTNDARYLATVTNGATAVNIVLNTNFFAYVNSSNYVWTTYADTLLSNLYLITVINGVSVNTNTLPNR